MQIILICANNIDRQLLDKQLTEGINSNQNPQNLDTEITNEYIDLKDVNNLNEKIILLSQEILKVVDNIDEKEPSFDLLHEKSREKGQERIECSSIKCMRGPKLVEEMQHYFKQKREIAKNTKIASNKKIYELFKEIMSIFLSNSKIKYFFEKAKSRVSKCNLKNELKKLYPTLDINDIDIFKKYKNLNSNFLKNQSLEDLICFIDDLSFNLNFSHHLNSSDGYGYDYYQKPFINKFKGKNKKLVDEYIYRGSRVLHDVALTFVRQMSAFIPEVAIDFRCLTMKENNTKEISKIKESVNYSYEQQYSKIIKDLSSKSLWGYSTNYLLQEQYEILEESAKYALARKTEMEKKLLENGYITNADASNQYEKLQEEKNDGKEDNLVKIFIRKKRELWEDIDDKEDNLDHIFIREKRDELIKNDKYVTNNDLAEIFIHKKDIQLIKDDHGQYMTNNDLAKIDINNKKINSSAKTNTKIDEFSSTIESDNKNKKIDKNIKIKKEELQNIEENMDKQLTQQINNYSKNNNFHLLTAGAAGGTVGIFVTNKLSN